MGAAITSAPRSRERVRQRPDVFGHAVHRLKHDLIAGSGAVIPAGGRTGLLQRASNSQEDTAGREHVVNRLDERCLEGRLPRRAALAVYRVGHSSHSRHPRSGNPAASATLAEATLSVACR